MVSLKKGLTMNQFEFILNRILHFVSAEIKHAKPLNPDIVGRGSIQKFPNTVGSFKKRNSLLHR